MYACDQNSDACMKLYLNLQSKREKDRSDWKGPIWLKRTDLSGFPEPPFVMQPNPCKTFRFGNVIRTEVTTILMPSWATRVAIEKVWGRCFSSRSPSNLGGVDVNPFASSYLVDRLKWVDSLVGLKSVFILHVYRTLHGSPNTVPWGHRTRVDS